LFKLYPFVEKAWPVIVEQLHSAGVIKELRAQLLEAEAEIGYLENQLFDERLSREIDQ
jgi:hypothetical protein